MDGSLTSIGFGIALCRSNLESATLAENAAID